MRKAASFLVLILVAYAAGAVRHFGTDEVLAFVAPAVSYVTFVGDAVWSGVSAELGGQEYCGRFSYGEAVLIGVCLVICAIWALIGAVAIHADEDPFPSMVEVLWDKRPERPGLLDAPPRRRLPLGLVCLILPTAVFEFVARVTYFVCFTVATLVSLPFKALWHIDLSRLIPSRKCQLTAEERQRALARDADAVRVQVNKDTGHA